MEKKGKQARVHLKLHGSVRDVGFRFFIQRKASALGLTGWVRNRPDGIVELVVEGDKTAVEHCIEDCRKGPLFARVEKVEVDWQKPTGEFTRFEVR